MPYLVKIYSSLLFEINMKNIISFLVIYIYSQLIFANVQYTANEPDSVYLFSYATIQDAGRSGLKFAWSANNKEWFDVARGFSFVRCDYGQWGSQKRMINPQLMKGYDNLWHCIWQLNDSGKEFGHAASTDLIDWKRQTYFTIEDHPDFLAVLPPSTQPPLVKITLGGNTLDGTLQYVPYLVVKELIRYADHKLYEAGANNERTEQDGQRFAGLKPVNATLKVENGTGKPISNKLIGIFFEDINYAADGGLYAELIQNRDFEYTPSDRNDRNKNWNSTYAWQLQGENTRLSIDTITPIHPNNPHYAVIDIKQPGAALVNSGFDGIAVKQGEKYDFSFFCKKLKRTKGKLGLCKREKVRVCLLDTAGREIAHKMLSISSSGWRQEKTVLVPTVDATQARLAIYPQATGKYAMDMISLFPQKTFKDRKNGLRADLAQTLADLHPRFVRFPGGCVSHGEGLDNIYRWKNSIGPLEARTPMRNLWGYHQTLGLGFYEYFQFCEDIGAEPVPVIAAGVCCQNSSTCSHYSKRAIDYGGQQGGIPMNEMNQYVQDILDLIEYANGDARHSKWGKIRALSGHPKSFHLKYIGIGNEDLITDVFEQRYTMICNAIREKYPDITVIGTVGPFCEGTDYEEGWELATKMKLPMVDEHYYQSPGWFINNQQFYDHYDRNKSKVYLGEYAAHLPGRPNNIETALAEALYITALERNGDIVSMASYAPLLAKEGHTQWNPDLIYFNNTEVKPTTDYYVQQMCGQNSGDNYLSSNVVLDNKQEAVKKRIAVSVVRDNSTEDVILKLVNLLPVTTQARLSLPLDKGQRMTAIKTVLSGNPKDENTRPVTSTIEVESEFSYSMPAYSFTVIRVSPLKIDKDK